VLRDDATHPDIGLEAARSLIERHHVSVIIGAVTSTVTLKIAPECEKHRVVLVTPSCAAAEISRAGEFVFRNYPSDVNEAIYMADFARDQGLRHVFVLAVDNEFGRAQAQAFEARFEGGSGRASRALSFREDDAAAMPRIASEVRSGNPDGVYLVGYPAEIAALLQSLRAAGFTGVALGGAGVNDETIRLAGSAADGLVFPRHGFDDSTGDPAAAAFAAAYRARYHEEPDPIAAYAYDALRIVVTAMEHGGSSDGETVRRGLLALEGYRGASGPIAFDENGDLVQYPKLFIVKDATLVSYERFVERGGSLRGARGEAGEP
jgi:branched-chain amino acid transport system substrate-binding protein